MPATAIEHLTNGNVPSDMPRVEGVRHHFVTARGNRFHVAESGDPSAPAVVLLHGWPSNWYCWRDHFGPLADAGLRPVAIDLRGFGWSEATKRGYRKHQLALDILAVLDAMGIDSFRLVGHDWGGYVAFLLGISQPDRVEKLVLVNTGHSYTPRDLETLKSLGSFWYMLLVGAPYLGPALNRAGVIPSLVIKQCVAEGSWTEEDGRIYFDHIDPVAAQQVYGSFTYGGEVLSAVRGRYADTRLHMPTLFLYGDRDVAIKPPMLRGIEDHADDYRLEVLPGLSHFCIEQAPEVVAPKIVDFVR